MIASSDFIRDYWIAIIIGTIVVVIGVRQLLKKPGPKRKYHQFLLQVPLVSRLTRGINTARFTQTLSILAGSGVPILESLKISSQVIVNIPMREAVEEASLRIREGAMISKSLAASKLFPPMTTHLISSGEASGRLEEMLSRAATNQEREVDGLISTMLGVMQPLLVIVMAAVVLMIVLAILLPIFELNNLIQ